MPALRAPPLLSGPPHGHAAPGNGEAGGMDGVRHEGEAHHRRGGSAALSLAALGIVFGALGTSPL